MNTGALGATRPSGGRGETRGRGTLPSLRIWRGAGMMASRNAEGVPMTCPAQGSDPPPTGRQPPRASGPADIPKTGWGPPRSAAVSGPPRRSRSAAAEGTPDATRPSRARMQDLPRFSKLCLGIAVIRNLTYLATGPPLPRVAADTEIRSTGSPDGLALSSTARPRGRPGQLRAAGRRPVPGQSAGPPPAPR